MDLCYFRLWTRYSGRVRPVSGVIADIRVVVGFRFLLREDSLSELGSSGWVFVKIHVLGNELEVYSGYAIP